MATVFALVLSIFLAQATGLPNDVCVGSWCSERPLRPSQLPPLTLFSAWGSSNETVELSNGHQQEVAYGALPQPSFNASDVSEFAVLPGAVPRSVVAEMLQLLESDAAGTFDEDPDTVDGMPTYEIFIDSADLGSSGGKPLDSDPHTYAQRQPLRERLQALTQPVLNQVITPFIEQQYPDTCGKGAGRKCTPCYSLVRRYRRHERQSHATHRDGHAVVSVSISLSDYGQEYLGGLYVATTGAKKDFLGLNRGDAVVHQSNLLHGVKVEDLEGARAPDTVRWSWILWYRDSDSCEDHGAQWFKDCAKKGNPTCQLLHATKVGADPSMPKERVSKEVLKWNLRAAKNGNGQAAVKVARAYLKALPSDLPLDPDKAVKYFQLAVNSSQEPDAHFGLAQIALVQIASFGRPLVAPHEFTKLEEAISHLEAAANGGHVFSMFNLGLVHLFGYYHYASGGERNVTLAAEWFEASGLPEGALVRAMHRRSLGDYEAADWWEGVARAKGYGTPWRITARDMTGSGGAGGVNLNCQWPPTSEGLTPPRW